jgi:hypothetical protein
MVLALLQYLPVDLSELNVYAFYTAPIIFLMLSYRNSIDQLIVRLLSSAVATVHIVVSSEI